MGGRLDAIVKSDDVWVSESLENLNLAIEVLFELLVEPLEVDGFDGNSSLVFLFTDTTALVYRYLRWEG